MSATTSEPTPKPVGLMPRLTYWAAQNPPKPPTASRILRILVRILLITARGFQANELSLRAGSLTYTILLSLVPLLAMSTALIKGLGGDDHLRQMAYSYLATLEENAPSAPPLLQEISPGAVPETATQVPSGKDSAAPLTSHLRAAAERIFDYVDKTDFTTLGSIGILVMLITIIMVFSTIEKAMNSVWQVKSGRSVLRMITDYLALLVLMPIAINIGFAASTLIKSPHLLNRIEPFLPAILLQGIFLVGVPILSISLTLSICYVIFPNTRVRAIPALAGAFLAGPSWFFTQNIYIGLQIGVSNYNAIYGSFATLPLFLVWLYLGWLFILTGAQIAYACQNHHSFQVSQAPPPPTEQLSAAFDILQQVFTHFEKKQPLTPGTLPQHCPQHSPFLLTTTLDRLLTAGIIHIRDGKQHLFPSQPESNLHNEDILHAILGGSIVHPASGSTCQIHLNVTGHALPSTFSEYTANHDTEIPSKNPPPE